MKIALFSFLILILYPILGLSQDKSDYDALVSKSKALLNENPQEALKNNVDSTVNKSSGKIAGILGISANGIKKARYRLRKKMNLDDGQIQSYILSFT